MSVASQVRSVMRNINLFVEEIPLVIFRLEEIIASLDISLSQSEFQFTFYNVASKIVECSYSSYFQVFLNFLRYFDWFNFQVLLGDWLTESSHQSFEGSENGT